MSDYTTNNHNTGLWIVVVAAAGVAFLAVLYLVFTGGAPDAATAPILLEETAPAPIPAE